MEKGKLFNTVNGPILSPVKYCGENELPAGCYYDEGEVCDVLNNLLRNQIFPFLDTLERRLAIDLKLPNGAIKMNAFIPFEPAIENCSIIEIQALCENRLFHQPVGGFEVLVNIECLSLNTGTQLQIYHDKVTYMDFEETEDYPIHVLGLGRIGIDSVVVSINERFSESQLDTVFQWISQDLKTGNKKTR